jgi:hypothetical protein
MTKTHAVLRENWMTPRTLAVGQDDPGGGQGRSRQVTAAPNGNIDSASRPRGETGCFPLGIGACPGVRQLPGLRVKLREGWRDRPARHLQIRASSDMSATRCR